jgi:hypothetical protein
MKRSRVLRWCCSAMVLTAICFLISGFPACAESTTSESNAVKLTDEQLGELFQATVIMVRMGLYDEAETRCIQMLEQKPNDSNIKRLLGEVQELKRQQDAPADLKGRLQDVVIPELNVRDAAVTDVIDFLQADAQKRSKNKSPINFVWQAPESSKTAKVTLNLRQVPLAEMLKYVTESVGLRYRVDAHAVVIYQAVPTAPKESGPANDKSP